MSKADEIFQENCRQILSQGTWDTDLPVRPRWEDGTPAHTIKLFGLVNRYDLREEFPIQTIRRMYLKSAVDELLWIWQKKSNNIHDLNSSIWDAWADETGSIGKAYGYQLGVKHHYKEGDMDQVDRVLYDLKHNPVSRRILVNLYNHHDLSEMAQVTGLNAGELVHVIADCHIYDRHVDIVKELINRVPFDAPSLLIDKSISDFYAFTKDSFELVGYKAHELDTRIPVAV